MDDRTLIQKIKNYDINYEVVKELENKLSQKKEIVYKDSTPDFIKRAIYIKDGKIKMRAIPYEIYDRDYSYKLEETENWLGRRLK